VGKGADLDFGFVLFLENESTISARSIGGKLRASASTFSLWIVIRTSNNITAFILPYRLKVK